MKHKSVVVFTSLFLILFSLASCSKDSDDYNGNFNNLDNVTVAALTIVHAAPKTGGLDVALDIAFNGIQRLNLNSFDYTDRIPAQAYSGNGKVYIYKRGSLDPIFTKELMVQPPKQYTLFIVDTANKMDAVLLKDSSRAANGDSVRVRFANMSPDAGAVDVYVQGNTIPIATSVSYKNANDFISIKAGNDLTLNVKAAGTNTILASSEKKNLHSGNFYTIYITGFKSMSNTNDKLIIEALRHYIVYRG